jgi:hypothetical protein
LIKASRGILAMSLGTQKIPADGSIVPGSTWNFQAWYRKGTNQKNFTDAVSVTFE